MKNRHRLIPFLALLLLDINFAAAAVAGAEPESRRTNNILGGPHGNHPYVLPKMVSGKGLSSTAARRPWDILNHRAVRDDTLNILALLVEFRLDSSEQTTGNGRFGIYRGAEGSRGDWQEQKYYDDGVYHYDNLPHDHAYFESQLDFVRRYFGVVSRGRQHIRFGIYPPPKAGRFQAYQVPGQMAKYSPGAKKPGESWDDYYMRKSIGLMEFVRDAIIAADTSTAHGDSPFSSLVVDSSDSRNVFYQTDPEDPSIRHKTGILIFHAGASYLTDGGWEGYFGEDSPSDMIDAFVSKDIFEYFADTLDGVEPKGGVLVCNNSLLIDEIMLVSETSSQDSLNWGIHGILANQVARQLGIPDLFSTMSGISAIGAFGIMDFAGYSAGRGFIPPWPCAWVRAYMGWDEPVVIDPRRGEVTASVSGVGGALPGDTTILLVPINSHEYYLIENRQRNLTGDREVFRYDTSGCGGSSDPHTCIDTAAIHPYDPVNMDFNVKSTTTTSSVIDSILNYDVGLPASGVLVWHVDEYAIRDRLQYNIVNADSLYRGVELEEADGITDLGVMFADLFYQAWFDYGGAEDVFPHYTSKDKKPVSEMGPFTSPDTRSNDGSHTYLKLTIKPGGRTPAGANDENKDEKYVSNFDYFVYNYEDSVFRVTVAYDEENGVKTPPGWPKRAIPSTFLDPVQCDVVSNGDTLEIAAIDTGGRLYVWAAAGSDTSYGSRTGLAVRRLLTGDTLTADTTILYDSVTYLDSIPGPASFPTSIDGALFIPSTSGRIHVLHAIETRPDSIHAEWSFVELPAAASSYVCNYAGVEWAVGLANGSVAFGEGAVNQTSRIPHPSGKSSPVQALAVIDSSEGLLAAIDSLGLLFVCRAPGAALDGRVLDAIAVRGIGKRTALPPFALAVGNLDSDTGGSVEIVVSDSRQGLWLFAYSGGTLEVAPGWRNDPNDWPSVYHLREDETDSTRTQFPYNASAPCLADLDNDGILDILISGTNGVYAFNNRGVLLPRWPSLLDRRYWYQRGSVLSSPVVALDADRVSPEVLFASPTGEQVTFAVGEIDIALPDEGKIRFSRIGPQGEVIRDSLFGLTSSFIDSLTVLSDSLILPYIAPGGFIDARNANGHRPDTIRLVPSIGRERQSYWPLTVGGYIGTSPLLCDMERNGQLDLVAVADGGWVYRWELGTGILSDSPVWPQLGANASRTFAYAGPPSSGNTGSMAGIQRFYSYPNPTDRLEMTVFKYRLTGPAPARNVRLDIFTYTGYHVFSSRSLPRETGWNEYDISLRKFGPAVYRCRLQADFGGSKEVKYWKMAVIR